VSRSGGRTHYSYNQQYRQTGPAPAAAPTQQRGTPRHSVHDIGQIIVDNRNFADQVIQQMNEAINRYGAVSAGDLFDMLGQTPVYTDYKYGWMNLNGLRVVRRGDQYQFIFPELESLED
jgi:hypothetical protein